MEESCKQRKDAPLVIMPWNNKKCHSGSVLDTLQCSGEIRSVIILPTLIKNIGVKNAMRN